MPLPEKAFYRLSEIISAWGCGYSELHEYARAGALHFAVYLGELGDYVEREELPTGALRTTKHQRMQFVGPGYVRQEFAYLYDDDARRVLQCDENQTAVVSITSMDPIYIVGPIRKVGHFSGKEVAKRELVVTAAERARFELQHRLVIEESNLPEALAVENQSSENVDASRPAALFKFEPNFHGIGINLPEAMRRIKRWWSRQIAK